MSNDPAEAPALNPEGVKRRPRTPQQERSQDRVARALAATEQLLERVGPEKASIPEIAKLAGVPRAAIYQYFPDKYALFAHLAERHMRDVATRLSAVSGGACTDWRILVHDMIEAAAEHYNTSAVASILLLRGPFGDDDQAARVAKDRILANDFRAKVTGEGGLRHLPQAPDAAAIAVALAFACLKYGYATEGLVSPSVREEAARATIAYLQTWA